MMETRCGWRRGVRAVGGLTRFLAGGLAGATIALAMAGCSAPESSSATSAQPSPSTAIPTPTDASASEQFEVVVGPFPQVALRGGVTNDDEVVVNYMRQ